MKLSTWRVYRHICWNILIVNEPMPPKASPTLYHHSIYLSIADMNIFYNVFFVHEDTLSFSYCKWWSHSWWAFVSFLPNRNKCLLPKSKQLFFYTDQTILLLLKMKSPDGLWRRNPPSLSGLKEYSSSNQIDIATLNFKLMKFSFNLRNIGSMDAFSMM